MPKGITGKKDWRWSPDYRTKDGESYTVEAVESAECPVSAITPQSLIWLAESDTAAAFADAGVAAYGPDLGAWPGRAVDAHKLIQIEQSRLHLAKQEAAAK
ncbi:MAG: hypothetical protein EPO02_13040 [Nitrospirae bacterium]|nr:MAG: hypothetical protein EPO02_13040 [Nitrospirota bacterium]